MDILAALFIQDVEFRLYFSISVPASSFIQIRNMVCCVTRQNKSYSMNIFFIANLIRHGKASDA